MTNPESRALTEERCMSQQVQETKSAVEEDNGESKDVEDIYLDGYVNQLHVESCKMRRRRQGRRIIHEQRRGRCDTT